MRLYPPVWVIPRDAIRDDRIGGYRVPAGSTILLSPYLTHRHCALDMIPRHRVRATLHPQLPVGPAITAPSIVVPEAKCPVTGAT